MNAFTLGRLLSRYGHAFDVFGFQLQRLVAHGIQARPAQHTVGEKGGSIISLAPMEFWRCEAAPGKTVACSDGALWITQTGDLTDYIIRSGQTWTAQRHGRVIVQAMSHAAIRAE